MQRTVATLIQPRFTDLLEVLDSSADPLPFFCERLLNSPVVLAQQLEVSLEPLRALGLAGESHPEFFSLSSQPRQFHVHSGHGVVESGFDLTDGRELPYGSRRYALRVPFVPMLLACIPIPHEFPDGCSNQPEPMQAAAQLSADLLALFGNDFLNLSIFLLQSCQLRSEMIRRFCLPGKCGFQFFTLSSRCHCFPK
jgi:hypothetical protein